MKPVPLLLFFILSSAFGLDLTGAGSTFVFPVMAKWADAYFKKTGHRVNYQSIGSGGGIKQISGKTVDFGATDVPLAPADLAKNGLVQFPLVSGGVVPVFHLTALEGGDLNLSGAVLADIFLGKISKWNDPLIVTLNPGRALPDLGITVVHRSDGSGTSYVWTSYLARQSSVWQKQVGSATSVRWPNGVGGKGNEAVAAYVKRIEGSIGYIEFAFARPTGMRVARLKNMAGHLIVAKQDSFVSAVRDVDWASAPDFYLAALEPKGANSWPVIGTTYLLLRQEPTDLDRGREFLRFLSWALDEPQAAVAVDLGYVPLPAKVVEQVKRTWREKLKPIAAGL